MTASRWNQHRKSGRFFVTKLAFGISLLLLLTGYRFGVEYLVHFVEKYKAWRVDAIFLVGVSLVLAALVAYCLSIWKRLKTANENLTLTNAELARANRLKDEFLANMSHELRTPLNAIFGMTEGLQEGTFGPISEEQRHALRTVEISSSHLLALINDILDLAKIESGRLELQVASTTVASLCRSSLALIQPQATQKHIQLEVKLPPRLPDLWVDERRIRQVLINLLTNAVKFTPDGGSVTLSANCPQCPGVSHDTDLPTQNHLQISVTDTGIGIAPDQFKTLFQPFIQIDSALNRQYAGTGLGLALTKRIVERHGGHVGVTSEEGAGSRFTINLPCIVATGSSTESTPRLECSDLEPNASAPAIPPLVLLAEDNEANIRTVSSFLKAKGYHTLLARHGHDVVALARSKQPDLILMDVQMPAIDGLNVISQIRLEATLHQVPIIALAGLTTNRNRCLAVGADECLSKPIKLKQLVSTIQKFVVP